MKKGNESLKRLNLLIHPSTKNLIIDLKNRTGCTNMTEVIRRSLFLYHFLVKEIENGNEIWSCLPKNNKKNALPKHKIELLGDNPQQKYQS